MSFQPYGDPKSGQVASRPSCWGSQYNSDSRECRGCGWQNSCREQVIQLNVNRQSQQPRSPQTFSPNQTLAQFPTFAPAPLTPPVPVPQQQGWPPPPPPVQNQAPPVQQFRPPAPAPTAPVQAPQGRPQAYPLPQPQYGGYGSIGDPMFGVIGASPAPIRPQYEGETFVQRVAKNSILSGIEAMVGQVFLGIRQARWYPSRREQPTIEVGPSAPPK